MNFKVLRISVALATLAAFLLAATGAFAQTATGEDGDPFLQLRKVDSQAGDETTLEFAWSGENSALDGIEITENGERVDGAAEGLDVDRGVVLVLDSSAAMDGALPRVKRAATRFVEGLPQGTEVAIVRYSDEAELVRDFTTEASAIAEGIDGLVPKGAARMWDGVYTAEQALSERPELQANIVLVWGSPDTGSTTPIPQIRGLASSIGAAVFAVGLEGTDPAPLEDFVSQTGGRFLATSDPAETLTGPVTDSLNMFALTYPTDVKSGDVADLTVTVGDLTAEATVVDGDVATGNLALAPKHGSGGGGIAFLQTPMAKVLGVVLALVAVVLGVYAMILVFTKDEGALHAVLQPYSEGYSTDDPGGEDEDDNSLTSNALIQRAVELTGDFAERQGFLAKTEAALERANLPLRAAEALFFYAAIVVVLLILLFILTRNVMAALVVGGVIAAIPPVFVNYKASKRRKAFLAQLPDTLSLLSGTLRAGYSLMQGVEAVSQEVDEPMGAELRRVVTESRLGRPLEESLEASAERMASPDFSWAVMAIRIQREVGGNLAELLLTVADTMTQRERLRRDVAALTAEGKISAIVLGILPLGLAATMYVINREYITTLFTTKLGNFMLGYAVTSAAIGFYWMKKTIEIEI